MGRKVQVGVFTRRRKLVVLSGSRRRQGENTKTRNSSSSVYAKAFFLACFRSFVCCSGSLHSRPDIVSSVCLLPPLFTRLFFLMVVYLPVCIFVHKFQGNAGPGQVVTNNLKTRPAAKPVRIYPVENQRWPAMRVEIFAN